MAPREYTRGPRVGHSLISQAEPNCSPCFHPPVEAFREGLRRPPDPSTWVARRAAGATAGTSSGRKLTPSCPRQAVSALPRLNAPAIKLGASLLSPLVTKYPCGPVFPPCHTRGLKRSLQPTAPRRRLAGLLDGCHPSKRNLPQQGYAPCGAPPPAFFQGSRISTILS